MRGKEDFECQSCQTGEREREKTVCRREMGKGGKRESGVCGAAVAILTLLLLSEMN